MRVVKIGSDSPSLTIKWSDLREPGIYDEYGEKIADGKKIELPDDPQNNLVFDPRPIHNDRNGYTFEINVNDGNVTFTRTDKNEGWGMLFRLYFRNEEDVPPFDNSVPYLYEGQKEEKAPFYATHVKVKNNVTRIMECAFRDCDKLVSVDMANSLVTEIEDSAFDECQSLKHVTFPNTLKRIGQWAFWNCKSIEVLLIPPSVKSIGEYAFEDCSDLIVLKLPDDFDLNEVDRHIIDGCTALEETFPREKTEYKERLQWLKDRYDDFPLHKTCYNANVTIEQIQQCMEENPNSISDTDEVGMTALHLISMLAGILNDHNNTASTMIQNICEKQNNATSIRDEYGRLPLHYLAAIASKDQLSLIMAWAESAVDTRLCAASVANKEGMTALHLLALNPFATTDMIQTLFKVYPKAATIKDNKGRIPLHYAVMDRQLAQQEAFESILKLLARRGEESDIGVYPASMADIYGRTPLHYYVLNSHATSHTVRKVFHSKAATTIDNDGKIPLHYAVEYANDSTATQMDMFRFLALAHDRYGNYTATIPDYGASTAFDLALNNGYIAEPTLIMLYSISPIARNAIKKTKRRMGKLNSIITAYIKWFQNKVVNGLEHIHRHEKLGFVCFITTCLDDKTDREFICEWLNFFSNATKCPLDKLKIIAEWKGNGGRKVIVDALPRIRDVIKSRFAFLERYDIVKGPVIHKSDTAIVVQARDLESDEYYGKQFDGFQKPEDTDYLVKSQFRDLVQQMVGTSSKIDKLDEEFDRFDQSGDNLIQRKEFIHFCRDFFDGGQNRSVALKFMMNEDQFKREKKAREDLASESRSEEDLKSLKSIVVDVQEYHNDINDRDFEKVRYAIGMYEKNLPLYTMVLIMPFGDRNLESVYRFEAPDINWLRSYVGMLAKSLETIHKCKLCHSDFGTKNVVRFHGKLKLIDLDAATTIPTIPPSTPFEAHEAKYYVGSKFSSGILPPEMFAMLKNDKLTTFKAYFAEDEEAKSTYWKKVQPRVDGKVAYVVKTFKTCTENFINAANEPDQTIVIKNKAMLPYEPVRASPAIDLWSLGVLLYTLIERQPLFKVDCNDDFQTVDAFKELYSWSDRRRDEMIVNVKNSRGAWDLLKKLLSRKPEDRGTIEEVLDHPFFKSGEVDRDKTIQEQLDRMEKNQEDLKDLIKKIDESTFYINQSIEDSSQVLMKAVFEATEVNVPTSFIISPCVPEDPDIIGEANEKVQKALEFFGKIRDFSKCLFDPSEENIKTAVGLFTSNTTDTYNLYLIDEESGNKVGEPYIVELDGNDLAKYVPIMLNGLKVFKVANKVASIIESVIPPAATISTLYEKEIFQDLKDNIENMDPEKSKRFVDAATPGDKIKLRGAGLREFEKFINDQDKDGNFRGLKRVCDIEGNAKWVTEESYKAMKEEDDSKDGEIEKLKNEIKNLKEKMKELMKKRKRGEEENEAHLGTRRRIG